MEKKALQNVPTPNTTIYYLKKIKSNFKEFKTMNTDVDSRYVTGVILANGVEDTHKDILNKTDIKKIFIKYLKHDTDTMHSYIRNDGVDLLANWITETDREIAGKTAPEGSWLATFKVTNTEIIKSLDNGDIGGLSLGSVPKQVLTQQYWFLNQPMRDINSFKDLDTVDDAQPVFISFVDRPSNQYGLEIERENVYINKRAINEEDIMTDKKEITEPMEEKLSISAWEKLMDKFGINKSAVAEEAEETEVKTEPVKVDEPAEKDLTNKELLEKIPNAVANGITEAFKTMNAEQPTEEPEKDEPEKDEPEKDEDKTEPVNEEPVKTVPKIDKKATTKEEPLNPNTSTNFYAKSGRDPFGCRIRQ